MIIKIKKPLDCPLRQLEGSCFECAAVGSFNLVCDSDETDDFDFPQQCPLTKTGQIVIRKE